LPPIIPDVVLGELAIEDTLKMKCVNGLTRNCETHAGLSKCRSDFGHEKHEKHENAEQSVLATEGTESPKAEALTVIPFCAFCGQFFW